MKTPPVWPILLIVAISVLMPHAFPAFAADQTGEYLNYQEPKTTGSSWFSTLAYLFSVLFTFALVIGLAYFTSRFVGQRMGKSTAAGENRIILSLSLGPNRSLSVAEIAGKFLILGVTEHNINLLQEITDPEQINKLKTLDQNVPVTPFDAVFQRQLASLQQMSQRFPGVFSQSNRSNDEIDREKR
ncbi:MAG: flagellar biosynthetic protein FliO [Negativicutes bacterium]|nr:flagellar biosynthetic protein FliO [Negativicutes bacterium]